MILYFDENICGYLILKGFFAQMGLKCSFLYKISVIFSVFSFGKLTCRVVKSILFLDTFTG